MIFANAGKTIKALVDGLIQGDFELSKEAFKVYAPPIREKLRRKGFEENEVDDLASEVYMSIVKWIRHPSYVFGRPKFRILIGTCINRCVSNEIRKRERRPQEASIDEVPEPAEYVDDKEWDDIYTNNTIKQSFLDVEPKVEASTWAAFIAMVQDGKPAPEVAATFGREPEWAHQVKKRVLKMVRQRCLEIDPDVRFK